MNSIEEDPKKSKPLLSPREKQILRLMMNGLSYKMIAGECKISVDTVRFHIKNVYRILDVHSMAEAVGVAFREELTV